MGALLSPSSPVAGRRGGAPQSRQAAHEGSVSYPDGQAPLAGAYILIARAGIDGCKSQEIAGELEKLLTRLDLVSESMSRDDDAR